MMRRQLLLLLLLLLEASSANGRIVDVQAKMVARNHGVRLSQPFGFDVGGKLSINITVSPRPNRTLEFVLVAHSQVDVDSYLYTYPTGVFTLCFSPSAVRYPFVNSLVVENKVLPYKDLYHAMVLYCHYVPSPSDEDDDEEEKKNAEDELVFHVHGSLTMLNPPANQLSVEQQPYVVVFAVLWPSYLFLFLVWVIYLFFYRRRTRHLCNLRPVHDVMTLAVFCKFLHTLAYSIWFDQLQQNGQTTTPANEFVKATDVFADTTFLCSLVVISAGWGVTRFRLMDRELQLYIFSFAIYVAFSIVRVNCREEVDACRAYVLSFYGVRFVITFFVIVGLNANIENLRARVLFSAGSASYAHKHNIFSDMRMWFVLYLLIPIVVLLVTLPDDRWSKQYVAYLVQEALVFAIYLRIGYSFRPLFNGLDYPGDMNALQTLFFEHHADQQHHLQQQQQQQQQQQNSHRARNRSNNNNSNNEQDRSSSSSTPAPSGVGDIEMEESPPQDRRSQHANLLLT